MKSNDIPITRAEEEKFYGKEVTEHDIHCAVRDQLQALDADDCAEVASDHADKLLAFVATKNSAAIGILMIKELRALAQRRANRVLGLKEQA